MDITVCCSNTAIEPWLAGLRAALPQARISAWHSGAHLVEDDLLALLAARQPIAGVVDAQRGY